MNSLNYQIKEAIWELRKHNCREDDLIIAFSPIVERILFNELYNTGIMPTMIRDGFLYGVEYYNMHPFNEIVIYHKERACYFPDQLIKKIEVDIKIYSK